MKKIGLICLALVVALGALGTGYAMWYDTVTISGTVKTGSVDIVIENTSGDEVYKDLDTGALVYCHFVILPDGTKVYTVGTPPANGVLVGWTTSVDNKDDTVSISYNNIFPIPGQGWFFDGGWLTDFGVHCLGSVPVKLQVEVLDVVGIPAEWVTVGTDSLPGPYPNLEGVQLEYCNWISCFIKVIVLDGPDNPNVGMGLTGGIRLRIKAVQWNEYIPPPSPTPEE